MDGCGNTAAQVFHVLVRGAKSISSVTSHSGVLADIYLKALDGHRQYNGTCMEDLTGIAPDSHNARGEAFHSCSSRNPHNQVPALSAKSRVFFSSCGMRKLPGQLSSNKDLIPDTYSLNLE
jgi:hypothetical protein